VSPAELAFTAAWIEVYPGRAQLIPGATATPAGET
jgi:hypothetical protein